MSDPLLDRLRHACALSNGTMPLTVIVKDDMERARALALLKGRHYSKTLTLVTEAENAVFRAAWLAKAAPPPATEPETAA